MGWTTSRPIARPLPTASARHTALTYSRAANSIGTNIRSLAAAVDIFLQRHPPQKKSHRHDTESS
jgi:hypothetical protein